MRLLLDTHVWLWSRLEPERLGARARGLLEDPSSELWLSPFSVWEVLVLIEKGRVEVDDSPPDWIRRALRTVPMRECVFTSELALHSRLVELPYQDPVDRFLAASALVYELTLLTADTRLLDAANLPTLRAD